VLTPRPGVRTPHSPSAHRLRQRHEIRTSARRERLENIYACHRCAGFVFGVARSGGVKGVKGRARVFKYAVLRPRNGQRTYGVGEGRSVRCLRRTNGQRATDRSATRCALIERTHGHTHTRTHAPGAYSAMCSSSCAMRCQLRSARAGLRVVAPARSSSRCGVPTPVVAPTFGPWPVRFRSYPGLR